MEIDNTYPAYCSHILSYQPMYIYSLHTALNMLKLIGIILNGLILHLCIPVHVCQKSKVFFFFFFSNGSIINMSSD